MDFVCQRSAIEELKECAKNDLHSLMIEGVSGCGKTYLASLYRTYVHAENMQVVKSSVVDIRDAMDLCWRMDESILLCIENLDAGVKASSYTLLKFLEEPKSDVYVIITCQDRTLVPETILSRSVCVSINNPTVTDLDAYASRKDVRLLHQIRNSKLYKCVNSFSDIDMLFAMPVENMKYFSTVDDILKFNDSVSGIVWKLTHFSDGSEIPLTFMLRYLMLSQPGRCPNVTSYRKKIIQCMNDLKRGSLGSHAVFSKLVFDLKYGE